MVIETEPLTERSLNKEFFHDHGSPGSSAANIDNEESLEEAGCCHRHGHSLVSNVKFLGTVVIPYYWRHLRAHVTYKPEPHWAHRHVPGAVALWNLARVWKDYIICRKDPKDKEDKEPFPSKALVRSSWCNDLIIGFSMGGVSIPQGMSSAQLADLPVVTGLYNNMIYPAMYCLLGTSRHAVSGTASVESILAGGAITSVFGEEGTLSQRRNAGVLLAWCMAVTYAVLRVFRLAVVAELLADPVLSGFSTAASLVVASSQFKHVFGISGISNSWSVFEIWIHVLSHIKETHWGAVAITVCTLVFLKLSKEITYRFISKKLASPGPFLVVVLGCLISYMVDLNGNYGIAVVGDVPSGLPTFMLPTVSWNEEDSSLDRPNVWAFVLEGLKITCLFFVIHIAITKSSAHRNKYEIDHNQELVAFAGANAMGAALGCYPACTSMSRTAVTDALGGRTPLHGFAACALSAIVVAHVTEPVKYMPQSCLAAIIMAGVKKMFQWRQFRELWRLQKSSWAAKGAGAGAHSPDLLLWVVAFITTLAFNAMVGILTASALSLLCLGRKLIRPDFVELGRLPGTDCFRNVDRSESFLEVYPTARVFRYDAPLSFANSKNLEKYLGRAGNKMSREFAEFGVVSDELQITNELGATPRNAYGPHRLKVLILDCSSIVQLDITAITCILRANENLQRLGITLVFSNWNGPQRDFLAKANFYSIIPPERCFLCTADALMWALTAAVSVNTRAGLTPLEQAHLEGANSARE